jgi:shikimate kinase
MSQPETSRVFLIGPMGAGKSTLGRYLSRQLDLPFRDSDNVIEERTGADIPWIFDVEGEQGFRDREQAIIDELTRQPELVLATGGGVVEREANRRHLHERGVVIYLYTPVAVQLARTRYDRNRPLLQTPDPEARLRELMAHRDPLYREVAHHVVPTESGNMREVTDQILGCLGNTATG